MIDPRLLRQKPEILLELLRSRGLEVDINRFIALDEQKRTLQVQVETLQSERNSLSKQIGHLKSKGDTAYELTEQAHLVSTRLDISAQQLEEIQASLNEFLSWLPNLPHESVPLGQSEHQNLIVRTWGHPRSFPFEPKDHVDLGQPSKGIDLESAAILSGSRFVVLRGDMARLHRALGQYMLDLHTKQHGYEEITVPYLVSRETLFQTGQLPKMEEDLFKVTGGNLPLWLIPTSEVPVTNLIRDQILEESELPQKWVCHSACFRAEAGSYGKDTRGMLRQHQFEKVELVQIVHPDRSYEALEQMTRHAEAVLQGLELPYRVVALCTGDLGFCASKTYDLEVWIPSQNHYREISSCSNTEAFQARRLKGRFRPTHLRKTEWVHTLNGSGVAIGRALVAVVENHQEADGSIKVPAALQAYMGGQDVIRWN